MWWKGRRGREERALGGPKGLSVVGGGVERVHSMLLVVVRFLETMGGLSLIVEMSLSPAVVELAGTPRRMQLVICALVGEVHALKLVPHSLSAS